MANDFSRGGGAIHREGGGRRLRGEDVSLDTGFCHRGMPLLLRTNAGATDYWPSSLNQSDGPRMIGHHPMGNLCETRDMEADYKTKNFRKKISAQPQERDV